MTPADRRRFDALLERVLEALPEPYRRLLDEAPLVVEDAPDAALLQQLGFEHPEDLCGLHEGLARTERSVEMPSLPDVITLFREGILAQAGGWDPHEVDGRPWGGDACVREEIRITLLHEMGHHFGLGEDDLERLGYG